jgi:iron complex outermembrane receptor protein
MTSRSAAGPALLHRALWCLSTSVGLAAAGAARAQAAPEPAASEPAAAAPAPAPAAPAAPVETRLETVVVTAERRSENIKNVPISISTLSGEKLDVLNSGGQDIRFLAARVPSLNIESSFGRAFPRFYIRGLGNTDFDLNASQPVSLVYDDVVQENPILKGFPVFDLAQIEVLRGPQGTLFGRNTPAGVVKFDSARPKISGVEGYGSVSLASLGSTTVEAAYNQPLSAESALRISMQYQGRDDWVSNSFDAGPTQDLEGYKDTAARVQWLYQPDKSFSALANLHARHLDGSARLFRANIIKPGTNDLVDGFDPDTIALDGVNEQTLDNLGGSLRLRWAWGDKTVHSITGYETVESFSRGDIDGSAGPYTFGPPAPGQATFPAESADGLPEHKQFSQEFRVESNDPGPMNWQGGLYYFNEDLTIDSFNYDSLGGGAQNGFAQQTQKNTAWAVFGSVKYALSAETGLRGGLRWSRDEKEFSAQRFQSPIGGGAIGPLTTNPSASDLSWDLSGTHALDATKNLYARVARGFRAPSIQGRILFGDEISVADSENVTSIEAGIKADLLDQRARLSFNVFHYTVKDHQLTAVGGAANFNEIINAEKSVGQGFELDLDAYLTDNLRTSLGLSYNHTEIKDPDLFVAACGGGCTVLDPENADGDVSINGNPLPQAPLWVANATLRYGMPTADGGEWFAFTDWSYRSKVNFFLYESVEYTGKPLVEGGLRLGYVWPNGRYELAFFGRNITDEVRVVGGIDFNNLTGFINEPRIWGLQFKAQL